MYLAGISYNVVKCEMVFVEGPFQRGEFPPALPQERLAPVEQGGDVVGIVNAVGLPREQRAHALTEHGFDGTIGRIVGTGQLEDS